MIGPDAFRTLLGRFATGVSVVTARGPDGRPVGATVSAFASVSLDPPIVLVCLNRRSRTGAAIAASRAFAVNVLREDQSGVALAFASRANGDRFAGVDSRTCDVRDTPVVCDALANIVCVVHRAIEVGDHTIYLGLVVGGIARPGEPLVHCRGEFVCARPLEEQTLPYPWCVEPEKCRGRASCPRDPNCGD